MVRSSRPPSDGITLEPKVQRAVREIIDRLGRNPVEPLDDSPAPPWLIQALHELLGRGRLIAYRPQRDGDGRWGLGDKISSDPTFFSLYDFKMREEPAPFRYNPLRPELSQQNRACLLDEVDPGKDDPSSVIGRLWPGLGLRGHDQLRVLICNGGRLLAWIGGIREEPYSRREQAALAALIPAVERALTLRRLLLDTQVIAAGLERAMEALGAPAFIAHASGRVAHANSVGVQLLEAAPGTTASHLRDAIAGRGGQGSRLVSELRGAGTPDLFLVVLDLARSDHELWLIVVAKRWQATHRELNVLRWLVRGDANKEIAIRLNCSEVSVERHVTALLRKAACDSRSRLLAAFWSGWRSL